MMSTVLVSFKAIAVSVEDASNHLKQKH